LTLRVAVLLEEPGNGVTPADTDEPADNRVFALDKERKELWRYPYNKKAEADLDTPEANQMREKLAQRKAKRRARFERIFNRESWTHSEAVSWIGYPNKSDFGRPVLHGLMYPMESRGWLIKSQKSPSSRLCKRNAFSGLKTLVERFRTKARK
jgi:hypothetical protein